MIWYFDLETVQDEKGWYLRIPKVWLLDYTPQMITQISAESFSTWIVPILNTHQMGTFLKKHFAETLSSKLTVGIQNSLRSSRNIAWNTKFHFH